MPSIAIGARDEEEDDEDVAESSAAPERPPWRKVLFTDVDHVTWPRSPSLGGHGTGVPVEGGWFG